MGLLKNTDDKRYLYILADGKMHEKVEEGTEGAILRVHEADDGTKTEKWEMAYPGVSGMVTDVAFFDGSYGTNINIVIEDEEEHKFCLSLKASSRYGEAFMEALPNLDLNKEVTFKTYSFPDKNNKDRRVQGMTIMQDGEKIRSHFTLYDEETKTYSYPVEGYPVPDAKTKKKNTSEAWKIFFAMRNEWLKDYLTEAGLIKASPDGADEAKSDEAKSDDDF